jgi:hypothetical protein
MSRNLFYWNLQENFHKLLENSGDLFLVSPFTNSSAIEELLRKVPKHEELTLVTRWRMEDIASGVSDVEVYPLIRSFEGRFFVSNRLHAKYFRKGNQALVGSSNLTHNGFSLGRIGNIEALVPIDISEEESTTFEAHLLKNSILVDDSMYEKMSKIQSEFHLEFKEIDDGSNPTSFELGNVFWWPRTRNPEILWETYLKAADPTAKNDLEHLSLPKGITDESVFKMMTFAALELHPNLQEVLNFIRDSDRRFGEMRQQLEIIDPKLNDSTIVWQTLFRWLLFFNPEQFEYFRPNHSEIIKFRK